LVELIIVIIIVGILASLGLTQYEQVVEKSRLVEAKVRIGVMRQLAYQYYLENGTCTGMTVTDLGINTNTTCSSGSFYRYSLGEHTTYVNLVSYRCTSGGKNPNTSREYDYALSYHPDTGQACWYCYYTDDHTPCFGLPSGC
jgi:Tfp pilus assembly protein PilE